MPKPAGGETDDEVGIAVFRAARAAFPDGQVSIRQYNSDHPKLALRHIDEDQLGVRVTFDGYAIAGMVAVGADEKAVADLVKRLKQDRRKFADSTKPAVPV